MLLAASRRLRQTKTSAMTSISRDETQVRHDDEIALRNRARHRTAADSAEPRFRIVALTSPKSAVLPVHAHQRLNGSIWSNAGSR